MQGDKTVLEVFSWLEKNEKKCLCEGLNAWLKLCSCGVHEKEKKCALLECVELSPKCIELFQVWATLDTQLGTNLVEAEFIPCVLTTERHEEIKDASRNKCDARQRETLCHLLVTCFALVLEHTQLDTATYLTQQSRVVIGSCLLKYCLRPLYRLMKFIDFGTGNFSSVCRLLKSFTLINANLTEIFFNSFNFHHPIFLKLLVYPKTLLKRQHVFFKQHTLIFHNGFLDLVHCNEARRQCRQELVQLFLNLLSSPHIMELLQKKNFFLYIIKYLCFDSIPECFKILNCLKIQICDSTVLSHRTKIDIFSYNTLESLCWTWTLYGIVQEIQNQSSQNISFLSENDKETLIKTLNLFQQILQWRMCHGFFETEKEIKIVKECSSWLQNVFFIEQQELFCKVLRESPVYCIDILEKLEKNFLTQQVAFCLPSQPCLCGVWIHYTTLIVRLLHPCTDLLFDSCDVFVENEELNFGQVVSATLNKKKNTKKKLIFEIEKHLLPFHEKKCFSSFVEEPSFWLPALHETQEECTQLSQCVSLVCGGVSHFFNSSNLTSILLNSSPTMVFIGLSVLHSFICRSMRLKKRYASATKLHAFLDRFMMMRLVDLQTLIHLVSKFVNDTPSLPYDWCLAHNVGDEKVRYDYREEEEEDLEMDDVQLPIVQDIISVPIVNPLASERLSLFSCHFSLKNLLQEFHRFLSKSFNEETDLFSRWCSTLEMFFRCLSCDKSVTHFNWCQLLNLSFNAYGNNLSKKLEWKCIERQMAVLKLLDAVWNLNTFDYDEKKHCMLQEQTNVHLAGILKWFQSVFRLWQYLLQWNDATHVSWILSLEKCIENFLYQTGVFTTRTGNEEIRAWMEFLKSSWNPNEHKNMFSDFFINQIENVFMYYTEFFELVYDKRVLGKKSKAPHLSFFTMSCCSLWYETMGSFIPLQCVTKLCRVLKKRVPYEMLTAVVLFNTFCDFLLTLAKKGNLKKQRTMLGIISTMRFVNFFKDEMPLHQVKKRIKKLQEEIASMKTCVLKRPREETIVVSNFQSGQCIFQKKETKVDWIKHFEKLIETMETSYLLQEEWCTVQEKCKNWMCEEKTNEETFFFLSNVERCLEAMSSRAQGVCLFQKFQKNHVFHEMEQFFIQILNNPLMSNMLNISLKCIVHYVFIITVVLVNETKATDNKKKWSRRPRYDCIKEFLKKIRFTFNVTACCEDFFQLTRNISKDCFLQLSFLKFLVLYSFAFKEDWSSHWPLEWINSLIITSYEGSLSEKDKIIAWIKQQALTIQNTCPIWFEKYHGFHEHIKKEINQESFHIQQNLFTWFQPNATRLSITLNNFPYHQTSCFTLTSFQDIFTCLFDSSPYLFNDISQKKSRHDSHMFPQKEFIYDPAYLFPFLLEKFQIAWYALHPTRQSEASLLPSISHSQNITINANKITFIECFTQLVDKEGIWLRRIASEGILQLLILGLACTDSKIRYAASQALALYRHFLLASLQETMRREQVYYQKNLWKKAVALCKQNSSTALHKSTNESHGNTKDTIYKMYCQLKEECQPPQRLYYTFKEIREILTLLDLLKNTITLKEDGSLSSLCTTLAAFGASCVPILLDCSHSLYIFVNKFLISRACLNSTSLPLFLTNYWSVRPKSCQDEAYFVFLIIARCFGSKSITQNDISYYEMIQDSWTLFNQQGVLPLLLTKVPYFNSEFMIQNITYRDFTLHAWNVMMKILHCFSNDFKHVQWLLSHYGVLQWIENHLHPLVLCLKHDEKMCFIRRSSCQEIQMFSQLMTHYFITCSSLLEKFKSVLLSPQRQSTICEEKKKYSLTEFHEKNINSLLQLIQSLDIQTKTQLGSSFLLECC